MPNKAVSKKQYRFFRAVQGGYAKAPGLSAEKAGEMIGHQSPRGLPETAPERVARRMKGRKRSEVKIHN